MIFVNEKQTPEQRRNKYNQLRKLGFSVSMARKLRDYRETTIRRFFNVKINGNVRCKK